MSKIFTSIILILLCYVLQVSISVFADEEDKVYVPYPLVFAHGLASDKNTWNTTEGALDEYYRKYEYVGDHFYFANYGKNTDRDIQALRGDLIGAISQAMNCFPTGYRSEKKVIVVNHSTGGIVTRLANNSRIHKTVFIGVPNRGFPGASAIVLLDNIRDNVLPPIISKYSLFWGMVAGSRFQLLQNPLPSMFYRFTILYKLLDRLVSINQRFRILSTGIRPPDGKSIKQLILPERVTYEEEISGTYGIWYARERVFDELKPEGAFLNNVLLSVPANRRIITGLVDSWDFLVTGIWLATFGYRDKLNFSEQNLEMAEQEGDGLITLYSQTYGIGGSNVKTYQVQASHIEETTKWQTILKAIDDDPPQVTKIEAVPADWKGWGKVEEDRDKFYIVIGIKEYLLADIEVLELTLNGKSLLDQLGGSTKPYDVFGKKFLKKRKAPFKRKDGTVYELRPGEFYVVAEMLPGIHELRIKIRNPARKVTSAKRKFSRPNIGNIDFDAGGFSWTIDVPPYDNPNRVPEVGSLSFAVTAKKLNVARISANVYKYKTTKVRALQKKRNSGGEEETEVEAVEYEKIIPEPSEKIYTFMNGAYLLNGGRSFSDLLWGGSGNSGEGRKYPVFIKAELIGNSNIQGLAYTNWQDYSGWKDDVILGDPTFIQISPVYNDKIELALCEIERLEREYSRQINGLVSYRLYTDVDIDQWIARSRANSAGNKEIQELIKERKKDIYKEIEPEIARLKRLKSEQIESIWLDLLVEIQDNNNRLWLENLERQLRLGVDQSVSTPGFIYSISGSMQ